jgi:hypothetical protein
MSETNGIFEGGPVASGTPLDHAPYRELFVEARPRRVSPAP